MGLTTSPGHLALTAVDPNTCNVGVGGARQRHQGGSVQMRNAGKDSHQMQNAIEPLDLQTVWPLV